MGTALVRSEVTTIPHWERPGAETAVIHGETLMPNTTDPVASKVQEHGWAVVNVETDVDLPTYSYSVGLYKTFSHPEVIVFGLAPSVLQQIINTIGQMVRDGHRFSANETTDQILVGNECAFRLVAPGAEAKYMGTAVGYYGGEVPALHCIWPDQAGRFPWEHGTSAIYRTLQPMLSEGPEPYTHTRPF